MEEHDLVVVGAGSGLVVASAAAEHGDTVAVIEEGPVGGTCLNRGCIPSKQLAYHADVIETVTGAGAFHVDASLEHVDVEAIVREVNEDVAEEAEAIADSIREAPNYTLYDDEARFVGERTLEVPAGEPDATRVRGDKVVLAAGTRPRIPPIEGLDEVDALTSREALQLATPPEELVVAGGGYVAAELAHVFGAFGSEVTILGRRDRLLPGADTAVGRAFTERYRERFTVHTGYEVRAVEDREDLVEVHARSYGAPEDGEAESLQVMGDELLLAAGRVPNTDRLDVETAGIETDADGFVRTDARLRTTAENVWALGDILGKHPFKHAANHEAQAIARNLYADDPSPVRDPPMPFAVFASPEVAGVGVREQALDPEETPYATSTHRYEDTARGSAMHAEGFVKVIVDEEGRILGCHVLGPDASSLIQEVLTAMTAGSGTIYDVLSTIHIHPALPEVVQRAFTGPFHAPGHEHHHHREHGEAANGTGGAATEPR
jgi:dihydrolipoamide dehydrogenase